MPDTRGSLWIRHPDRDIGPLWVGLHTNERAGETVLVGLECWAEEPGTARTSLGPAGDPTDDLLPWPALPLRSSDLAGLRLEALTDTLRAVLSASGNSDVVREAAAALRPHKKGRPLLYDNGHYRLVAGYYLKTVEDGSHSPTLDVARGWGVSRSAAAKWVMRCRSLGLLPRS